MARWLVSVAFRTSTMLIIAIVCMSSMRLAIADALDGPYKVLTIANVAYGPAPLTGSLAQGWVSGNTLDECLPQPTGAQWGGPFPGIVFIHGGNWQQGYKDYDLYQCQKWASNGYIAVTINYRLVPDTTTVGAQHDGPPWPAPLVDVQLARRWMAANARTLNLAYTQILCHGDSAGGSLCVQGGFYNGIYPSPGDPAASLYANIQTHFNGVISEFGPAIYGYTPLPENLVAANWVNSPSTLLVQGSLDTRVVPDNSTILYNILHSEGRPVQLITFPGGHEFVGLTSAQRVAIEAKELQWSRQRLRYFGFQVTSP